MPRAPARASGKSARAHGEQGLHVPAGARRRADDPRPSFRCLRLWPQAPWLDPGPANREAKIAFTLTIVSGFSRRKLSARG